MIICWKNKRIYFISVDACSRMSNNSKKVSVAYNQDDPCYFMQSSSLLHWYLFINAEIFHTPRITFCCLESTSSSWLAHRSPHLLFHVFYFRSRFCLLVIIFMYYSRRTQYFFLLISFWLRQDMTNERHRHQLNYTHTHTNMYIEMEYKYGKQAA